MKTDWSIAKARELYSVAHWGGEYFDVGPDGRLLVRPPAAMSRTFESCEAARIALSHDKEALTDRTLRLERLVQSIAPKLENPARG